MAYSKEFIQALTNQVFKSDEGHGFHDAIFEATGESLTPENLRLYFGDLSQHLQALALLWGLSDTEFRDEVYENLCNQQQPSPTKYRSTACS
jgi:hypothetical protein